MVWNESQNHDMDCYLCNTTLIKGFNAKNKQQIAYADIPSMAKPVFIHVPKAENSLAVIENKWLHSEGYKPEPKSSKKTPILFDQAEFLGSRLKEKTLLNENVRIFYRKHKHIASEWRLFINSNKTSLKGVLLHNGNEFPSIPVAYASHLKECYEFMKILFLKINYYAHCWSICSNFKVIAILLELQT